MQDRHGETDLTSVHEMLLSKPVGLNKQCLKMWKRLNKIDIVLFNKFWTKVEKEEPLLNSKSAKFEEWASLKQSPFEMKEL